MILLVRKFPQSCSAFLILLRSMQSKSVGDQLLDHNFLYVDMTALHH